MSERSTGEVLATIVVTPRERFSTALRCLPNVIANTQTPHRLVYVAGGAPAYVRRFLGVTCAERGYDLILRPDYLATNPARNLGLQLVETKYAVFLDNDVLVEPGWLDALVCCAEETGAAVVGPLCLIGERDAGIVHTLGGDLLATGSGGSRSMEERHRHSNIDLKTRRLKVERFLCDYVEFHCMLVRRDLFTDSGGLMDPDILAAAEHIDIALLVRQRGEKTYTEPKAVVSYLNDAPYVLADVEFFELRWSDGWQKSTLDHFATKWRLDKDSSFFRDYSSWTTNHRQDCQLPTVKPLPVAVRSAEDHPFAQTILQLTAQMRTAGYTAANIQAVLEANRIASRIHEGVYRENGKTFVAHAVGTASVLAAYGAPESVIVAGLLHSAYALGRFPDHLGNDINATRRWLAAKIGANAEAQVFEYAMLDFERARQAVPGDSLDQLPLRLAYAILMRIANSVDEHLDNGLLYTRDAAAALAANTEQNERWDRVYGATAHALRCHGMLDALLTLHGELCDKAAVFPPTLPAGLGNYVFKDGKPLTLESRQWQSPAIDPEGSSMRASNSPPLLKRVTKKTGPLIHRFAIKDLLVLNDGVLQGAPGFPSRLFTRRLARLITGPQWSYSCSLRLEGNSWPGGEAFLRLTLSVSEGELGLGVLSRDSTTEFLAPEQRVEVTQKPVELLLRLPDLHEAGMLITRSSAPGKTVADIHELSLHAPLNGATESSLSK